VIASRLRFEVAERLGGQAVSVPASSVAGWRDRLRARQTTFTHIVTSTAQRNWWSELLRGSAAHEIIRRAGDISVHVVPEQFDAGNEGPGATRALLF